MSFIQAAGPGTNTDLIVDREGKLVGILTESDFVRHVYRGQMGTDYVPSWSAGASTL